MTNTQSGIGTVKNFATLGDRCFENVDGTVQYAARRAFSYAGTDYAIGDTINFNVLTSPQHYSAAMLQFLQLMWDQENLTPLT